MESVMYPVQCMDHRGGRKSLSATGGMHVAHVFMGSAVDTAQFSHIQCLSKQGWLLVAWALWAF